MTISFKKFVELVDQEDELTEDQIQEIFGVFSTANDKQAALAKQKSAEFQARRDALKKKAAGGNTATDDDEDEDDPKDPRRLKNIQTKPGQKASFTDRETWPKNKDTGTRPFQSAAAKGNAAERDWLANMEATDPAKTLKRLARQHALAVINNGDNKEPAQKVEDKIKALPNGREALRFVKQATRKWVAYASDASEVEPGSVSKEDMKKVDAIVAKAIDVVSKPLKEARESIAAQVLKDLEEQKKIGVRVSPKALAYPLAHEKEMQKYYDNGMSIEEIADHVKTLARI